MKLNWIFALSAMILIVMGGFLAVFLEGTVLWAFEGALLAVLVGELMIYRMLAMPLAALRTGVDLLKEQDFASKVRKVGQRDADNIAETFNAMMQALKNERLRVREQDYLLNLLIEASPTGIVMYDFEGNVRSSNKAAKGMLRGALLAEVDRIPQGETRTVRLNDQHIYRCSRLSFLDRGFQRPFMIVESLTEEVMQAERSAYEKVIRTIAHEVNNTMAGVLPLFDTVEAVTDDGEMREAVTAAAERCGNMSRFITRYAEVVKVPQPRLQPCGLNGLVCRSLPFLESLASGRGIAVRTELAGPETEVSADPVLLEQVFVNLVKNAAESIGERYGGEIVLRVSRSPEDGVPMMEITDNGDGIPPGGNSGLFTPFYSTKPGGQGLGLMLVSQILRRHGCRFSLSTDPETTLTTFRILFPGRSRELPGN